MKEIDKIIGREDAERLRSNSEYKDSVYDAVMPIYNAFRNEKISSKEEKKKDWQGLSLLREPLGTWECLLTR